MSYPILLAYILGLFCGAILENNYLGEDFAWIQWVVGFVGTVLLLVLGRIDRYGWKAFWRCT